jgi:hypothetical protein
MTRRILKIALATKRAFSKPAKREAAHFNRQEAHFGPFGDTAKSIAIGLDFGTISPTQAAAQDGAAGEGSGVMKLAPKPFQPACRSRCPRK